MNKNGFVFIETIVSIIILTTALLLLYSSYNKILQINKTRVYYDDINYLYRTWYLKNELQSYKLNSVIQEMNNSYIVIGLESNSLFNSINEKKYLSSMLLDFNVREMVIVKQNELKKIKKCKRCLNNNNCTEDYCKNIKGELSDGIIEYLNSFYVDLECSHILVVKYNECNKSNHCQDFYSWVSV